MAARIKYRTFGSCAHGAQRYSRLDRRRRSSRMPSVPSAVPNLRERYRDIMTTYRERRMRRAERLRGWSEKRAQRTPGMFASARQAVDGIPPGQPILVGHHSERRHRAALERHDSRMRAAFDNKETADRMARTADEIERQADAAIYDDDPDALERLHDKLSALEARRDSMTAANAAYRKAHRAELQAEPSAYQRSQMVPFPSYSLQNLGGNITRTRQRIARLSGSTTSQDTTRAAELPLGGLTSSASITTPTRPGKSPPPVWNVTGNIGPHRAMLQGLGGSWYRSAFSFWEDPTAAITAALA